MRWLKVFVLALLLIPAVAVAAPAVEDGVKAILENHEARIDSLEARVQALESGHPPPTTTTTIDSSTTTVPDSTTTTRPAPTPDDYIDHCTQGMNAALSDCFEIRMSDATSDEQWWYANYARQLFYSDAQVEWTDGDRSGYRCAYMHLTLDGEVVGRATFTRAAAYGFINDSGMVEWSRGYDGGKYLTQEDCPSPDVEYTPDDSPGERPVIRYMHGLETLEIRSYPDVTILADNGKFLQTEVIDTPFTDQGDHPDSPTHTVYSRVTVVFYTLIQGEWVPAIVVWYDSLHPEVTITSDL